MKYFIVYIMFITTIQLSHQSDFAAQLRGYFKSHEKLRNECMAKIHLDKTVEYNYEVHGDIINDENFGCFLKCILLKEDVINEAGEISIEHIKKNMHIPENDNLEGLKKKCSQFDVKDLCQGSLQFVNCYSDYMQSHLEPK